MDFQNQDSTNPYEAPSDMFQIEEPSSTTRKRGRGRCPRCGSDKNKVPSFTWWGGMVGQRIINHTVCKKCGTGFNKKTGKSNTTNIILYQAFFLVLGLIVFFVAIMGN